MKLFKRMGVAAMAAMLLGALVVGVSGVEAKKGGVGATVVQGGAFYFNGDLYRTVLTPTDLSHTGAPDHSFDVIYDISEQTNVTTVAPGYPGYNGGRWMVIHVSFDDYVSAVNTYDTNGSGNLDSAAEVEAAINDGVATTEDTGTRFVCPVIKL